MADLESKQEETQPISQIQITLNFDANGVSLNEVKSIDQGEGKFDETKRIAPNTNADAIAGMISGLDKAILEKFNTAYANQSSASGISGKVEYESEKDKDYYFSRIISEKNPSVNTIKSFLDGIKKKNGGKFPKEFETLYTTLYSAIEQKINDDNTALADTINVDWYDILATYNEKNETWTIEEVKETEEKENEEENEGEEKIEIKKGKSKTAKDLWVIVKAHNPFITIRSNPINIVNKIISQIQSIFEKYKSQIPVSYETVLKGMERALKEQRNFYIKSTLSENSSSVFNYGSIVSSFGSTSTRFTNLASNLKNINFKPRKGLKTIDGRTNPSWYLTKGEWNNKSDDSEDRKVQRFIEEMVKPHRITGGTRNVNNIESRKFVTRRKYRKI